MERDHGWSGLCIEPNPIYWELLSHRKCDVVAAVVGASTNEEVSFAFNIWKGGIIGKDFDNKNKKDKTAAKVKTITLLDVFQIFNVPNKIDYLSYFGMLFMKNCKYISTGSIFAF